ncbi:general secretion pathway protein I [Lysobacter dokdonensis DS-58]|uniref:General secretion pathway protein I n=1 Tax=Lysobacter dokdonensis DS-58 TaxID=1300345 RepID=A0A0A2WQ12_9GAMM|nr:prepilin-type N-terminal cleavage/methylation domain-containing protein [Lysobacter dokdonensis]KGQ20847.1 general secretion pathway protein I [Lysobacter dokdonensis DS-58]
MSFHRRAAGFTLIEVILAFALLALGLTILLGILSGATKQVRWADDAGRAAMHAQTLIAQQGVGVPLEQGHKEGVFEQGKFRWTLDVEPWRDPSVVAESPQPVDPNAAKMFALDLQVQWGDGAPRNRLRIQSLRLVAPSFNGAPQ